MRLEWEVPITTSDGTVLRADVFRPADEVTHPVLLTHGPYAKGLPFQTGYAWMWDRFCDAYPEVLEGSTNAYQNWETVDPEKWVPDGYACVRVDCRGAGRSAGYLDIFSPQETEDFYECIEWAGTQPWSNGKVGLLGISYYAINQYLVAGLQPPHLAAICPWEGAADYYRDFARHGGMLNTFVRGWTRGQVLPLQHGRDDGGRVNPNTGELVTGPERLSEEELSANRADWVGEISRRALDDDFYRDRSADFSRIAVPMLSAANWAHHLHTRGNFEAYTRAATAQKWLEVHGLEHFVHFYTDYGRELQKRFFDHFLKGTDTRWESQPPVVLNLRRADGSFVQRAEQEWPLARTDWTRLYLDAEARMLTDDGRGRVEFDALGGGVTFLAEPATHETEITGSLAAKLFVSSTTADADIFVVLRVLDPQGNDVKFVSAIDPAGVVAAGYLRASHRKLDLAKTLPYRPWHTHDEAQPLTPGEVYELDVEIWPTSVIVPAGYRIGLTVLGRDFEFDGDGPWPEFNGVPMKGNGLFLHDDRDDRPVDVFGGKTTIVSEGDQRSFLLLPIVPSRA